VLKKQNKNRWLDIPLRFHAQASESLNNSSESPHISLEILEICSEIPELAA
jgi:hypothetical protein